ncbi:acetyl esterase [Arboricoccus pini]|uniref:Acetyl esterase n=1 Tax=Arboricoccus pini TaxID=1963835 RepID=A0A212RVA8_9PROT|nr:alpha/beta hydrolase [Arboricoccus pini]SNB76660.1 acetyl esterase [Arboricoccus pini]
MSKIPTLDLDAAPNAETAALIRHLAREEGRLADWLTLDAPAGRALAEETNRRWNVDLPPLALVRHLKIQANDELGTPTLAARLFAPANAHGVLLYVHGGGWAFCSLATHERAMRLLALASGMAVVGVAYRLAPEHPFPVPLLDTVAAWRALSDGQIVGGGPYAIGGDSAGANLALAAMLHEQREGRVLPRLALLYYGVYANDHSTPSHRAYGRGFGLTTQGMERYWAWYIPDASNRANPLASPLLAEDAALAGLPPLWLNAAGLDPLASDSLLLAARLRDLGRDDPIVLHAGVLHGFMQQATVVTEGRQAFQMSGDWAREILA